MDNSGSNWLRGFLTTRVIARAVLILWAASWMFFNIASGLGEIAEHGYGSMSGHFMMAAVAVAFLIIAWRYELVAGIIMVAAGISASFFFNVWERIVGGSGLFVALVFLLPVVVVGVLLIASWISSRKRPTPAR